jgi:hypothetical protein
VRNGNSDDGPELRWSVSSSSSSSSFVCCCTSDLIMVGLVLLLLSVSDVWLKSYEGGGA